MADDHRNRSQVPETTGFFDGPADRLDEERTNVGERVSFVVRLPNGRRLVREARAMTVTEAEFLAALK